MIRNHWGRDFLCWSDKALSCFDVGIWLSLSVCVGMDCSLIKAVPDRLPRLLITQQLACSQWDSSTNSLLWAVGKDLVRLTICRDYERGTQWKQSVTLSLVVLSSWHTRSKISPTNGLQNLNTILKKLA